MRYVIIGNSAAGIGAVEGIRQIDKKGEITIISNEYHHTYSRPLISYLLQGRISEEKMKYRDDNYYKDNGCRTLFGKTAVEVRPDKKHVLMDNGSVIPYDRLLIATGSSPFVPPFEGLNTVSEKYTFLSLDDAQKLEAVLSGDKRVLIAGAGLIGLKCAEGILDRVRSVTVLDLASHILSSILDEDAARLIQRHMETKGIDFRLCAAVGYFDANRAVLKNGDSVEFDLLVMTAGVRPNTELLSGIAQIDKGILINEKSETTAEDIYAAGDCTQTLDVSSGENRVMALLPGAYMQGECAGINMAGGNMVFNKAIPMNAIGFFGKHIITAGNYCGNVYAEDGKDRYKRLFYSENKLNGYILMGNVEKAGIYTSLIRERTPLDSVDFSLICERPGLMAFTKEVRDQKLGGAGL